MIDKYYSGAEGLLPPAPEHFSKDAIAARIDAALNPQTEIRPAKLNGARFSIRHSGLKEVMGHTNNPEEALEIVAKADEEMDLENSSAGYRTSPSKLAARKVLIFDNEQGRHIGADELERIVRGEGISIREPAEPRPCPVDAVREARIRIRERPLRELPGRKLKEPSRELTPRELDILIKCAGGLRGKEVADKLGVSGHTVNAHTRSAYEKLNIHSRKEAREWLIANGHLPKPEIGAEWKEVIEGMDRMKVGPAAPAAPVEQLSFKPEPAAKESLGLSAILHRLEALEQRVEQLERERVTPREPEPEAPVFSILLGESTRVGNFAALR